MSCKYLTYFDLYSDRISESCESCKSCLKEKLSVLFSEDKILFDVVRT